MIFKKQCKLILAFVITKVISRDPDDPNKTRMAILAQADAGGGLPPWVSIKISIVLIRMTC
jgi:hypothetical protein